MNTITLNEALAHIYGNRGKVFACKFTKRGDGSLRLMCARLGVKKGLVGGPNAYDPIEKKLIWCYDMLLAKKGIKARRSIPIEGLQQLYYGGKWIKVVPG